MTEVFRRTLRAVSLAVVTGLCGIPAAAQSVSGSISGTVADQSGQLVPAATVTLTDEQTGVGRTTLSTEAGSFLFSAAQPGRYTVRVELAGFSPVERTNITLPASERLSVGTITLRVGAVTETVTTTAEGSFVQTLSSERSALLTATQLDMVAVRAARDVPASGAAGCVVPSRDRSAWGQLRDPPEVRSGMEART